MQFHAPESPRVTGQGARGFQKKGSLVMRGDLTPAGGRGGDGVNGAAGQRAAMSSGLSYRFWRDV